MNATPRVRSGGFPQSPGTAFSSRSRNAPPASPTPAPRGPRPSLPIAPEAAAPATPQNQPLIPLTIIDAPTQRFYACSIYIALLAYRLYDWVQLIEDETGSFFYFSKWIAIDFLFLFAGLPSMRIPWLEFSQPTIITVFFVQFVFNWILMFNVPVPWQSALLGVVKYFYDRELSISEHSVKISNILHNSSLIMGKQIINILPEGSALLNPDKTPYCLGQGQNVITIPIHFNATVPVEVELLRIDLDTNAEEIVSFTRSHMRELSKIARAHTEDGVIGSYKYDLPVKKPGVYQLHRVLDEYKLQVQRTSDPTYVVPCPSARIRSGVSSMRCLGQLSDLAIDVQGSPPLKLVYSRVINGQDRSFHFQSLQPDGFTSPMLSAQSLISPGQEDFTWARSQKVAVGLNDSMSPSGHWQYSIDEVHDSFGNVAKYVQPQDEVEAKPRPKHLFQEFTVRERPLATLVGCDSRKPLKVAKGKDTELPVRYGLGDRREGLRDNYVLEWQFSPIDTLTPSGDHGDVVEVGTFTAQGPNSKPRITAPGLYTLKSITCDTCEGEIQEPSSCLLFNPPEPELSVSSEPIPDKCAGNSIGLRVTLDLTGTPPFTVWYDISGPGGSSSRRREQIKVDGLRQQIDLLPRDAGHYEYNFRRLEDAIYDPITLGTKYHLQQTVKPPATAFFADGAAALNACLDAPISLPVRLLGDGPFTLEWELVYDGRKKAEKASDIKSDMFTIQTPPLAKGGEYVLALTSIQDKTGCRIFLKEEVKINVRRQRPRASFGLIDNKRSVTVVEDGKVSLPLRLSGDGPWKVSYKNLDKGSDIQTKIARSGNDILEIKERGTYEIVEVEDKQCPGAVDPKASTFEVNWFARPQISLVTTEGITQKGDKYIKQAVCEGDIDGFDVALQGSPPFHVEYDVNVQPQSGSFSIGHKELDVALNKASISMDTSRAGKYTYKFSALADTLYNTKTGPSPLTLEHVVNARPSASFVKPGQTFKLCMTEQDFEERIPLKLVGVAPFYVEVEIKHHLSSIPEVFRIPNIPSNNYDIQIPRPYLKLGAQQVRIRKVRDARGCQQKTEIGGPSVHLQLFDAPAIYPLEARTDYCVGERIAYTLSGTPPFDIHYTFGGVSKKAKSTTTNFRRVAESAGDFSITSISDKASECRAAVNVTKTIHPMPSVRISKGRVLQVDIHEGSEVEILFEFGGTPPFEFTYTRSSNARKGARSQVLETRHDISYDHTKVITASLEGTYEVVSIKDRFCSFSTVTTDKKEGQKLLQF